MKNVPNMRMKESRAVLGDCCTVLFGFTVPFGKN